MNNTTFSMLMEGLIKLPPKTRDFFVDQYAYWSLVYAAKHAAKDADEIDQMMIDSVIKKLAAELGVPVPSATDISRLGKTIVKKVALEDLPPEYLTRLKKLAKTDQLIKLDNSVVLKLFFDKSRSMGDGSGVAEFKKDGEANVLISIANIMGGPETARLELLAAPAAVSRRINSGVGTVEHELTHAIQYLILRQFHGKQTQSSHSVKLAAKKASNDDKYYLSQIEFDPTIKSSIKAVLNKFKLLKANTRKEKMTIISDYVWAGSQDDEIRSKISGQAVRKGIKSKFFAVLKLHDLEKWKKAVKLLTGELITEQKTTFKQLLEREEAKQSFWDIAKELGIEDTKSELHDGSLPWVNHNNPRVISKYTKDKKYKLMSQLELYKEYIKKHQNTPSYGTPFSTTKEFLSSLDSKITLWRGGYGKYDPEHDLKRPWVSFTASRKRANTFSIYDGTHAKKMFELPKREKDYWVVELEIPLKDVLLYLPFGQDEEVIVSKETAKKAKVIIQESIK